MDRESAYSIVKEHVTNINLIRHMLAVEAAMQDYAKFYNEDPELWVLAGLLHDFDWEIHPTLEEHPHAGAPILRERQVPEIVVRCILSHAEHTGVPRKTIMEKSLFACDEVTGLITAVALVRPSKSIHDVKVKSVKKKWKDRSFAANVNREDIEQGAQELEVDLWEHVGRVIHSMQRIANDLGLEGVS
jgi:putative nucleotidyltransferase with HDIG domain